MLPFAARRQQLPLKQGGAWFNASAYADLAVIADFNNDRYALPALSAEHVVNGDFSSATGWTVDGSGGVSGGKLNMTNSGFAQSTPAIALKVGAVYRCTFTIDSITLGSSSGISMRLGLAVGGQYSAPGTYTEYITYTGSGGNTDIYLVARGGNPVSSAVIDNFSVQEVILTRGGQALGANLGANGYTMSVNGGTGTATESPTGQLNLTGDGTNQATADKQLTGLTVGRRYRGAFNVATNTCGVSVGTTQGGTQVFANISNMPLGFVSFEFTATATTHWIRFFRTSASLSTVTAIEIRELPATGAYPKRSATFAEFFAYTAASTTARSYVAADGTSKNDLAADTPRFDYRNGKRQLRLEDGRTNLLLRSQELGNAAWGANAGSPTIASDNTTAPDGTLTADKWTRTTTAASYTGQSISKAASALPYALSWRVKPDTGRYVAIRINGTYPNRVDAVFDLQTGTVSSAVASGTFSGATASIRPVANGFFAVSIASTSDTATTLVSFVSFNSNGVQIDGVDSSSSSSGWAWQAQLEQASFASDPIVTISTAVARAIETARFSSLVEAVLGRAAFSVVVRGRHDAGVNDAQMLGFNAATWALAMNNLGASAYNGSSAPVTSGGSLTTSPFGAAAGFDSAGMAISRSGATQGTSTTVKAGDFTRSPAYLARNGANYIYGPGLYDFVGISPERLANSNIDALAVAA